jgi:hypothetical protein
MNDRRDRDSRWFPVVALIVIALAVVVPVAVKLWWRVSARSMWNPVVRLNRMNQLPGGTPPRQKNFRGSHLTRPTGRVRAHGKAR